jgi:hypothetical protein
MVDLLLDPLSRTFIPAKLSDNPYLEGTGYKAKLQALPEPLRTQLLFGDFLAGRDDHDWQVIPTEWVTAAQERWHKRDVRTQRMVAVSADIAMGGKDNLVIGAIYDDYTIPEMAMHKGVDVKDPRTVVEKILHMRKDAADISVDYTGGWGTGVKSHLDNDHNLECFPIVYSEGSSEADATGKFGFKTLRSQMYWQLREALDPNGKNYIPLALPPSSKLKAELTAPRYSITGKTIYVESKDDIKKRLKRSTDEADVVVQLVYRFTEAQNNAINASRSGPVVNLGYSGQKSKRRRR